MCVKITRKIPAFYLRLLENSIIYMLKNSGSYLHDNPANCATVSGDIKVTSWESHFVFVKIDG